MYVSLSKISANLTNNMREGYNEKKIVVLTTKTGGGGAQLINSWGHAQIREFTEL